MRTLITLLFACFLLTPSQSLAQNDNADSVFYEFAKCLSSYFKKEFKKIDTSYLFFYGSRFNVSMDLKTVDIDGGRNFINNIKDALDSTHLANTSNASFFFRGMSLKEFLDYTISQRTVSGGGCILRKEKGVKVFVDCPDEAWQHFYFDKVLYQKEWALTPVIDVIQSDGENVQHGRFILLCSFTPLKGFTVTKKFRIHEFKNICSK